LGDSVQLNPITNPVTGLSYMWLPPAGLSNAFIKNPWAKPTVTTTYNLIVGIPGTNCKKDASMTVTVKQCTPIPNGQRKASEEEEIDDIKIAPNPTQSSISVQIPDSMNWEKATLINAQGVVLNEQNRMDEAKSVKFDVQLQPSGMYIVRVKTDKGFVNKKVIKE
jgi:Secretion system C-terminal sorting domain